MRVLKVVKLEGEDLAALTAANRELADAKAKFVEAKGKKRQIASDLQVRYSPGPRPDIRVVNPDGTQRMAISDDGAHIVFYDIVE